MLCDLQDASRSNRRVASQWTRGWRRGIRGYLRMKDGPVHPHGELGSREAGSSQAGTSQRYRESRWHRTCVHRAWGWPPGRDFSTCFTVNMCPTKGAGFCPSQGHILLELSVDLGWSWTLFQPLALLLARCCGVLRGSAPSLSSEVTHYFSICCDQESVTLTTWASVSSLEKFI